MAKKDTMQVVIDEDLKRQFKSACVLDGTNMSEVVSDLITGWLEKRQDKPQDVGQQDTPKPSKREKK